MVKCKMVKIFIFIQPIKLEFQLTKTPLSKIKWLHPKYYDSIVPYIDIDIKGQCIVQKPIDDA